MERVKQIVGRPPATADVNLPVFGLSKEAIFR
jgi:hypothetical protein